MMIRYQSGYETRPKPHRENLIAGRRAPNMTENDTSVRNVDGAFLKRLGYGGDCRNCRLPESTYQRRQGGTEG